MCAQVIAFFWMDLKDAYFHIHIAPHHRPLLRFTFEVVVYQYTILPYIFSATSHFYEIKSGHFGGLESHLFKQVCKKPNKH